MSAMDDLSFDRLDVDGALADAAEPLGGVSRAGFLGAGLGASLALLGLGASEAGARQTPPGDLAILNFALTLEYLQAAFYTEAERMGALQGRTERAARVVGAVERAHVKAFRDLLGGKAVKRPAFDFQGVTEKPQAFLKTAVAFEDLAVAAYKGQATNLKADSALAAAVSIHSVEARHAAWMRYLFGANPARSAFDEPSSKREVTQIVRSTNFITGAPATKRKRTPRFTG
jgi:Ferritin-like domain